MESNVIWPKLYIVDFFFLLLHTYNSPRGRECYFWYMRITADNGGYAIDIPEYDVGMVSYIPAPGGASKREQMVEH